MYPAFIKREYKVSDEKTDFKVKSTSGFLQSDQRFSAASNLHKS